MKESLYERIKKKIYKGLYYLRHPEFKKIYSRRFSSDLSQNDLECCIVNLYELRLRKKLDLNNVKTFNEKLNWLKCFYHNDKMTECADKVTAPAYFMKQTGLGDNYIVKNIGIYDNADDIKFEQLPNKFVLKSNWGSGLQIIVNDKSKIDLNKIKAKISKWNNIESNHYFSGFEYGYKKIEPKIVCEEFITFDYKIEFFCFDGKPVYFWTVFNDKTDEVCANFYDAKTFQFINMKHGYPNSPNIITKPNDYGQMFEIAEKLSKGFPFVRIDFFKTADGFKFSEMTFYHWCGFMPFEPDNMDLEFGKNIVLPDKMI